MKKCLVSKGLIVVIMLLFIGASIVPSISGIDKDVEKTDIILSENENSHVVFVEEGTATWCSNCPDVAEVLHNLYDDNNPDFYYVSLVEDKSTIASNRLENDYNIYGFPTVYVDGGYKVIVGANNFESEFKDALSKANNRDVPNIYLNLTSEWNETRREITNKVLIKNDDEENYSGILKIYITEIISSWRDYNDERYSYTLIDYGYNDEIELDGKENKKITKIWEASDSIDKDNLWIIAVVFNSDPKSRDSDPIDNSKPFDAYFVDAAHGVKVTEEAPVFLLGTITNLNVKENYTTFNTKNLLYLCFNPFTFNIYRDYEEIMISNNYFGFVGQRFIIGLFHTDAIF